MKLDNKGFAITGILYTLLILFSLILISVLAGLSSRLRIMEKSIESLEDDYKLGAVVSNNTIVEAPVDGKYVFNHNKDELTSLGISGCVVYLESGSSLIAEDLVFTDDNCNSLSNEDKANFILREYYPFVEDGS